MAEKNKTHTFQDTIAEVQSVSAATNAGSWWIVTPPHSQPVAHFVKNSEEDQYNLLTDTRYSTQQRADLALAVMTRPTQLTHQERQQLLVLLASKDPERE